jgi:hypothetical protein
LCRIKSSDLGLPEKTRVIDRPAKSVQQKIKGWTICVHSFQSLIKNMATIVRITCRRKDVQKTENTFTIDTLQSEKQAKAFELVKSIKV